VVRTLLQSLRYRDADWLTQETFAVLERHRACLCVHDLPPRHPLVVTGRATYVRFHGAGELCGGSYSKGQLRRWAKWMHGAARSQRAVYAYFNNDAEGNAVRNALTLRETLE
jgi:uncharacterized protein YecE (DUF72 family)